MDRSSGMVWVSTSEGRILFANLGWRAFRGLKTITKRTSWTQAIVPGDLSPASEVFNTARAKAEPFVVEYRVDRPNTDVRWVCDVACPRFDEKGEFLGYVGCGIDVTKQRAGHYSLVHPSRRLEQLVGNAHEAVYRLRYKPTTVVEYVSGAIEEITGRQPEDFYKDAMLVRQSLHPDDVKFIASSPDQASPLPTVTTFRWVHPNGRVVWADHFRVPVFDGDGQIVGLEGIARNVTERVENERKLRESEEQMRRLAARLQEAREEERREVSRELHDEVGQTLTALKLEINRAVAAFGSAQLDVTSVNRLQSVVGLVDLSIATVKRISGRLRPATLDHLGLAEAIRWEALTFKARTGIRCHVRAVGPATRLSAEQQTALFRIVQEALNNVVCHARASSVRIAVRETDDAAELRIQDNGRGITAAQAAAPESIGLRGMHERAVLIGGKFKIAGQRGKGTTVSVLVPYGQARGPEGSTGA